MADYASRMRAALLFFCSLLVLGFVATIVETRSVRDAITSLGALLLPREISIGNGPRGPLELRMDPAPLCQTLTKTDSMGVTQTLGPICQGPKESFQDFLARVKKLKMEWCASIE